jgi:hypothetical protein
MTERVDTDVGGALNEEVQIGGVPMQNLMSWRRLFNEASAEQAFLEATGFDVRRRTRPEERSRFPCGSTPLPSRCSEHSHGLGMVRVV